MSLGGFTEVKIMTVIQACEFWIKDIERTRAELYEQHIQEEMNRTFLGIPFFQAKTREEAAMRVVKHNSVFYRDYVTFAAYSLQEAEDLLDACNLTRRDGTSITIMLTIRQAATVYAWLESMTAATK